MLFPKETFIEHLKLGLVVKYPHSDFPDKDHFFVIVDNSPNKVPPMLSLISSKDNSKKNTYITIEENEYQFFTKKSYIDCDKIYDKTPDELYSLYENKLLTIQGKLTKGTLEKIKNACHNSKLLEKYYKKRIVQAYNKTFESI